MQSRLRPAPRKRILKDILKTEYDAQHQVVVLTVLWDNSVGPEYVCMPLECLEAQLSWPYKIEKQERPWSQQEVGPLPDMSESQTVKEYQSMSNIRWLSPWKRSDGKSKTDHEDE